MFYCFLQAIDSYDLVLIKPFNGALLFPSIQEHRVVKYLRHFTDDWDVGFGSKANRGQRRSLIDDTFGL